MLFFIVSCNFFLNLRLRGNHSGNGILKQHSSPNHCMKVLFLEVVHPQSTSSRVVHPQSTSSRVVHPQSTSNRVVHPQSTSSRVVHPQSTSSRVVHPQSTSNRVVHSQSTSSRVGLVRGWGNHCLSQWMAMRYDMARFSSTFKGFGRKDASISANNWDKRHLQLIDYFLFSFLPLLPSVENTQLRNINIASHPI